MLIRFDWRKPGVVQVTAEVPVGKGKQHVTAVSATLDDPKSAAAAALDACLLEVDKRNLLRRKLAGKGGTK